MAAADHGGPDLDHYQLLGVSRGASREEITQAWRRRARAEHPDHRPRDAGAVAADRFRALANAYHVLSEPARRAAYDRVLERDRPDPRIPGPAAQAIRVRVRRPPGPGAGTAPLARAPRPPLRAGPVQVEGPRPAPAAGGWDEQIRLAVLADLVLRYLARDWDRPW
jgi:curved DNA-binding protein CbpA